MKNKSVIFLCLITLIFSIISFKITDDGEKNKILLNLLVRSLKEAHFDSKSIDNQFSEKVYKLYLDRLDYNKRFFIESDVENFEKYKELIDDQINKENLDFFELTDKIYQERVVEVGKYYKEALKKPFDFSKSESIETDPEKLTFCKNKKSLKEYWTQFIKYQVMTKLADKLKIQEDASIRKDTLIQKKSYSELEIKSREEVLKTYTEWFSRMEKLTQKDRFSLYLNSITSAFDPHTEFYPPEEKENFDIQMSGKLEGIGAQLMQPNAYIKVSKIIPGSPCSRSGEISEGDLILKVAQATGEPVDVVDMKLEDAIKMIRGPKGTEVKLTLKKVDGSIKVISLIRDVIVLEETFAKSTVVRKDNKNYGYIYLPQFYADFENKEGRRCSKDVEKEIIKLKKENISGLVLDLRNNGGGSLQDVADMAGLFIDQGPVVQVKSRFGKPYVYTDLQSGALYSGPLVIMINEFSASASEILAAAIQDYDRGIIVGSETSFGKGTVQRFFDFDEMIRGNDKNKPYGAIKITTQKFYRINGGSTQLKGVSSDIVFPDVYSLLDMGEKDMEYPEKWDEIDPALFKKISPKYDKKILKQNSINRTSNDSSFILVDNYSKILKTTKDSSIVTLNLEKYRKDEAKREKRNKQFDKVGQSLSKLNFYVTKEDSLIVYSDSVKLGRVKNWIKDLKKDIYVNEVFNIVKEME